MSFGPEVPEIGNCRPIIDRLIAPDGGRIFKTRGTRYRVRQYGGWVAGCRAWTAEAPV